MAKAKIGGIKFGKVAFYIGIIIALVAGWIDLSQTWLFTLGILGVVVGLLNITGREVTRFMMATIALVIAGVALKDLFGVTIGRILLAYIVFTASAALVVALKEVYSVQKNR